MDKAFNNFDWEDFPSTNTPLDEKHLNEINKAVNEIDNRVIHLDATKASALEMSQLFSGVAYDEATGIITFTRKNGATITIDTKLEKLAVNFSYDPVLEQLIIVLDDGTEERVDLSALITQYEFLGSDTIAFQVQSDGKVTAIVKEGSIEEKHLRPNYLADVRIEVGKAAAGAAAAERSAQASATSETNAAQSEAAAAVGAAPPPSVCRRSKRCRRCSSQCRRRSCKRGICSGECRSGRTKCASRKIVGSRWHRNSRGRENGQCEILLSTGARLSG